MSPRVSPTATWPAVGPAWPVTRLSLDYLLDSIELSRGEGDINERLLLAAVIDANVAPIKQDPAVSHSFGAVDDPPPESLRRPVSINALAQSLGAPFETVRRRVRRLAEAGACIATPAGVVVAQGVLDAPGFKAVSLARFERLRRFHLELAALGALGEPGPAAATWAGAEPPVRVANRLLAEYMLRFIEGAMGVVRDPLSGLILMHVARANSEHLPPDALDRAEIAAPFLRPVGAGQMAQRLNAPVETVRRRIADLVRAGFCERNRAGARIAPARFLEPDVQRLFASNLANVQRLFGQLRQLGVLTYWEEMGDASAAPQHERRPQ